MRDTSGAVAAIGASGQVTLDPTGFGSTVFFQFDVDGAVQIDAQIGNQQMKALAVLTDERATFQLRGVRNIQITETSGSAGATVDMRGYVL